jgi:ElaB/YqjD/DUF883 family membrane-anchored ribosome-binding protein
MSRMNESMTQGQGGQGGSSTGQLKDTAQQVGQNIREMGSQVRDVAKEQYENLRTQASEYYDQGREMVNEYQQSLENYVQEQPVKSLLIAAGVGMLLGILWRRS